MLWVYAIVVTWARGICMMYMPKPEVRRPKCMRININMLGIPGQCKSVVLMLSYSVVVSIRTVLQRQLHSYVT